MRRQIDSSVLEMALVGYESERRKIEEAIAAIRSQLGMRSKRAPAPTVVAKSPTAKPKPKRRMSAAGRRAIRAALKKRWAAFHAKADAAKPKKKAAPKKTAPKAVSAEVNKKRIAALAKARAAKAAKKAAQEPAPF